MCYSDSAWIFYADEALSYGLELVYLIEEEIYKEVERDFKKIIMKNLFNWYFIYASFYHSGRYRAVIKRFFIFQIATPKIQPWELETEKCLCRLPKLRKERNEKGKTRNHKKFKNTRNKDVFKQSKQRNSVKHITESSCP